LLTQKQGHLFLLVNAGVGKQPLLLDEVKLCQVVTADDDEVGISDP
jgi:hypothetical protein